MFSLHRCYPLLSAEKGIVLRQKWLRDGLGESVVKDSVVDRYLFTSDM